MSLEYKFGIVHYLKLYWTSLKISFKVMFEYKGNFYASIVHHILSLPTLYLGYIFISQFGDLIGWDFADYIVLSFWSIFPVCILGTIYWGQELRRIIPRGNLNNYLYRPGNNILNSYINLNRTMPIFIIWNIVSHFPLILYFVNNFNFYSTFLSLIISIYLGFLFALISLFYDSFNFYFLGYSRMLDEPMYEAREVLETFPAQYFQNSKIKYFFMLVPTYFISTIVVPLFQNKLVENLEIQLVVIFIISIICIIGIWINWMLGLKKYEAYN